MFDIRSDSTRKGPCSPTSPLRRVDVYARHACEHKDHRDAVAPDQALFPGSARHRR